MDTLLEAIELSRRVSASGSALEAARSLFGDSVSTSTVSQLKAALAFDGGTMLQFLQKHSAKALGVASSVLGVTASLVIGLVVFVTTLYVLLVRGERVGDWIERHSPLSLSDTRRFAFVFNQTGRGLIVGIGLTALAQGATATLGYAIIGVPHALTLGLLTGFAALIPSVGSGLVWVPIAVALFALGERGSGIAILVVGLIVSSVDNFIRPALTRVGHLDLPASLVFLAMLGGMATFGAAGLIAGPLFVRLAIEGLDLWASKRRPQVTLLGSS